MQSRKLVVVLTIAAHGNGVRHANSVELPAQHTFFFDRTLHYLTKIEHFSISKRSWDSSHVCTYSVYWNTPLVYGYCDARRKYSLAWIALPPDRCDTDLGCIFHRLLVRDARSVQHGLRTREVMLSRDTGRPAVEGITRWQTVELDKIVRRFWVWTWDWPLVCGHLQVGVVKTR